MRPFVFLTSATLLFTTCQRDQSDERQLFPEARTELNVSYGTDARQTFDLYLPANRVTDSTPSIILIHGGGWVDGDKVDFSPYVSILRQQLPGYAIFNVNYRLAAGGQNIFPTQENDIRSVMNFINDRKKDYGISENYVLLGASAGAHLAMLQGYKYSEPVKARAVISFFGPTELKTLYNADPLAALLLTQLMGTTPTAGAAAYDQASPFFFAGADSPPTLFLHGGRDPLVPAGQSENTHLKLKAAGVATQYVFYPNESHGWIGAPLTDSFEKLIAFIKMHLE